jgi:hypothetical protein
MLCAPCRRRLLTRLPLFRNHLPLPLLTHRTIATAPATPNAAPIDPPPPSPSSPASSSASTTAGTSGSKTRVKEKIRSSVAGGAVLNGLGYTKAKPQVLAKEDEEYPSWLWGILDEGAAVKGEGVAGMLLLFSLPCYGFCSRASGLPSLFPSSLVVCRPCRSILHQLSKPASRYSSLSHRDHLPRPSTLLTSIPSQHPPANNA